jgi:flagellar hook-basal body complex protein FliE
MAVGPVPPLALSMVQPSAPLEGAQAIPRAGEAPGPSSFAEMFEGVVAHANAMSNVANARAQDLAAGRIDDIHGTMIEVQKASIEMKLVGNIRNKVVDAFYELWRMSV